VRLSRLSAAGDVAGPVLFTVAWVVGSLRHAGHSAAEVQLSGLAAEDAWNPQIMMAGFVLLGAGTVVLGAGLGRLTAPRSAGPWLVLVADAASVAAGLFRRDHMLLVGPGFAVNRGTMRARRGQRGRVRGDARGTTYAIRRACSPTCRM
jgi:hypothetical protein